VACYGFRNTAEEEAPQTRTPIEPRTIKSGFHSEAASKMTLLGSPVVTDVVTPKPAEESVSQPALRPRVLAGVDPPVPDSTLGTSVRC
jgi:hypothetical protein